MADSEALVQIDAVEALEQALIGLRRSVASTMRREREAKSLSLRDVAVKVNLAPAAVSNIERAKSWRTETARRIAQFYASVEGAA
jgi:ribosome-binding protein aMBF1 (putative translation factor)